MAQPKTRIVYTERPDTDPEAELSALINAYRFILFKSNASKKAAEPAPEPDGRKSMKPSPTAGAPGCKGEA